MDRNEFGQFITGHKSFNKKGKDSPMWKGGKPRCWCRKILSRYEYKNCGIHRIITSATRKKLSISLAGNNCSPKGEKNHLELKDSDMNYKDLIKTLKEFKCSYQKISQIPKVSLWKIKK